MSNLSPTTTLERCRGVLAQQVSEQELSVVLLNPKSGEYFTLQEVGARIWALVDGRRTIADIIAALSSEYDAHQSVIEGDVMDLVRELVDVELAAPVS